VDYAFDYPRVASFFAGDPAASSAWSDAIARARGHARPREAVAAMLAAQQERRQAPPEALAASARLADGQTVAIVTGQQAGLFGGPLFTILKAVTAIRLADRVSRDHGVPVVPVFWIDAEDHDWDEISKCAVLDADLTLREIRAAAPEGAGDRTIGSLSWTDAVHDAVRTLADALPVTEFTPWLIDLVRQAYTPGRSPSESFARLLEALLGPYGLVVYDASDPAAKPFVAELFADELRHAGRTALLAARAGADLVSRGYHMQVTPQAGNACLFEIDGGRHHIQLEGDTFVIDDTRRVPRTTLAEHARQHPEAFSPNVLLRPLVQDTIFPTACYVAGPNELAYLAQLRGVYNAFGVPMPLIMQRATATLLDSAAMRFITKHRVRIEALQAHDEHALNELLRTLLPPSVESSLQDAETALAERMEAVIAAVPSVDPTLEGKARSVLGRMQHELGTLHNKILQAAKRRDETLRRQFMHARAQAFPNGDPQERVVGGVSFVARYGPGILSRLVEELPVGGSAHWVITI
jgi:bacillithiol synthase